MNRNILFVSSVIVAIISAGVTYTFFPRTIIVNNNSSTEPVVHLIHYNWRVTKIDWEHQIVDVNFTLFNSGSEDAIFTLSIDLYDEEDKPVTSEEYQILLNGTTVQTFQKRFSLTRPEWNPPIDCIEFYCQYFFENSKGYEFPIH